MNSKIILILNFDEVIEKSLNEELYDNWDSVEKVFLRTTRYSNFHQSHLTEKINCLAITEETESDYPEYFL